MRILIATDAWQPQRNGVVRVLESLTGGLTTLGHEVRVISPDRYRVTVPCPTYPEISLAIFPGAEVRREMESFRPEAVHIATEGPIGKAARRICLKRGIPFTTAYHTKFPQYVRARTGLPLSWLYAGIRRFHAPSRAVLAPSMSVFSELTALGFANVRPWSHGVDTRQFRPCGKDFFDLPRPIFLYVGRVTVDKNLPAFLHLDLPGSKVVVGDGPSRASLKSRYPEVLFHIAQNDAELARCYSAADAFVFPSLTDTFGLVMLEAMACGVPVAAFPVTGPLDVFGVRAAGSFPCGCLDRDLRAAALGALGKSAEACRTHAHGYPWARVVEEFLGYLAPVPASAWSTSRASGTVTDRLRARDSESSLAASRLADSNDRSIRATR